MLLVSSLLSAEVHLARGQESVSVHQSVAAAQAALRHGHYSQAIQMLEEALKSFPANSQLRLELGRAYLYRREYARAIEIFRAILRDDPSNREAKLELARALSYDGKYQPANQLFRELLAANPSDEAAAIGLVRDLLFQRKEEEAFREIDRALALHPNSLRLQEYRDDLQNNQLPAPAPREGGAPNRLQADSSYFSDTDGNRAWRASQRFDLQVGRNLTNSFRVDEKSLWVGQGPMANIFSVNDAGRVRLTRRIFIGAGGGLVRFDNANRVLYGGELVLHPTGSFWLQGGFSRIPITPTFESAQLALLAEGWWGRLDWQPRSWRISADFSKQHYSDSNRTQSQDAEVLRWIGNPHLAVMLGYRYAHISFAQTLFNGYFSPDQYQSHLGLGGLRFGIGKIYRGEYTAAAGAETVDENGYQFAWEATAKNRFLVGKLEMEADYTYYHLAQSTGSFRSQLGRVSVVYRF